MNLNFTRIHKIFFLYCIFVNTLVFSQAGWQPLGADDFNQPYPSDVTDNSLAINPVTGDLYIALNTDEGITSGIMRKYNISTGIWENVGSAFSDGDIGYVGMAVNSVGVPYVCYSDLTNYSKATCKKFNDVTNTWELVGINGFTTDMASEIKMVIGPDDTVHVIYSDYALGATVKKFNGTDWVTIGTENFVANTAGEFTMAIAPDGILYVGYAAWYNSERKATVMKFNGSSWVTVGSHGFTGSGVSSPKIAINPINNMPYIAYIGWVTGYGYKGLVKKYNGLGWDNVGSTGFKEGYANEVCFAISFDGTLFAGHDNSSPGGKSSMSKFNGVSWEVLGYDGFSIGDPFFNQIVLNGNTPYMSYVDNHNGAKLTVMKYDETDWICMGGTLGISEESILSATATQKLNNMIITSDGVPYLGYSELTNDNQLSVKKYSFITNTWDSIGVPGSLGAGGHISMASYQNMPYIAFNSNVYPYSANVIKFNGVEWQNVGEPGFTPGTAGNHTLTIAPDGSPYIAFRDGDIIMVMKFNGYEWIMVGESFSSYTPYFSNIAIGPDNIPYIAYKNTTNGETNGIVMKFNGTAWEAIGGVYHSGNADDPSLAFNPDGYLYISYVGHGDVNGVTVKKFTGTTWQTIGSPAFSAGMAYYTNLAIKPDGQLYVSYIDYENKYKATIMRYNGVQWIPVGQEGISAGIANSLSIAITPDGQKAIIAYAAPCAYAKVFDITCSTTVPQVQDQTFCSNATVADLSATGENIKWYTQAQFGSALAENEILTSGTYYASQMQNDCEGPRAIVNVIVNFSVPLPQGESVQVITVDGGVVPTLHNITLSGNSILWYNAEAELLPADTELTNGSTYYATQTINGCESEKLAITISLNILSSKLLNNNKLYYYPNPVNDKLHITTDDHIVNVEIYNLQGQKVGNWAWNTSEGNIDMNYLSDGTYIVCLHGTNKSEKFTVIKKK